MKRMLQIWHDEDGVLSFEWTLLLTLLTIGIVLPAEPSVAGRVKEIVTGVLAWPVTSKRPAFVRSVAAIVLFTPGKTFPKFNCWAPTTLIGVCTLAVAVMLALFVWAWSVVPVRTRAATARESFVIRIAKLLCLVSSY